MTPEQIELIQNSFAKVKPIADKAGDLFYGRLFELAPGVRPLFPDEITGQRDKLMATLGVAVGSLTKMDVLLPILQKLGRDHNNYGAKAEHYPVVSEALIWTLEQGLGDDFTADVREAWLALLGTVSGIMIDAQNEAAA